MQFYIKSAIFFCCVLGYPVPLTPLTKLVEEGVNVEEDPCSSLTSCTDCSTEQDSGGEFICLYSDSGCEVSRTASYQGSGYVFDAADCPDATVTGLLFDECADDTHNCDSKAKCTDTSGGFSCSCKHGYQGAGTVDTCIDVDECSTGADNCDNSATCTNTEGSFTCTCEDPYHGNGTSCSDQDLYKVGDSCGSAGCTCPTGYVPTRQDVSDASQSDCQAAARFLGIAAANSCEPDDCQNDEIAYSNNSTRPKGCYHSCKNNKLYIAKNPSARTFYRTSRKTPVLADPSADCDSYIRLHLCQSKYL